MAYETLSGIARTANGEQRAAMGSNGKHLFAARYSPLAHSPIAAFFAIPGSRRLTM
jgi:hypothetical protein